MCLSVKINLNDNSGRGLIERNINSEGDKLYHIPGGARYQTRSVG